LTAYIFAADSTGPTLFKFFLRAL